MTKPLLNEDFLRGMGLSDDEIAIIIAETCEQCDREITCTGQWHDSPDPYHGCVSCGMVAIKYDGRE